MPSITAPTIIGPSDGESVTLQTIGVRFMIPVADSDGRVSLVEHPMPPRGLAAPLHRHNREDEYSFVLEGRMGALLGDDVVYAGVGDLVHKPRDQWHTFWNAGDEPCRILEIITPGGFDQYFAELTAILAEDPPDLARVAEMGARYGIEADMESIPALCARFGLTFGG